MAEEAEAEARAALKRFRALNGEQEGDTEAERFVQRQEREAAALVAERWRNNRGVEQKSCANPSSSRGSLLKVPSRWEISRR